jgi:hypothetical protein
MIHPRKASKMTDQNPQKVTGHVTTEKTSKALKAQQLAAGLLIVGGIYAAFAVSGKTASSVAIFAVVVGLAWMVAVSLVSWWNHG